MEWYSEGYRRIDEYEYEGNMQDYQLDDIYNKIFTSNYYGRHNSSFVQAVENGEFNELT